MKYDILLFDADNTLLDFTMAEYAALTRAFEAFGVELSDELRQTYVELNKSLWRQHERGEITRSEIFNSRFTILFKNIGVDIDGIYAESVYRRFLNEGHYLIDGAAELLRALKPSHRLFIITNGTESTQRRRLAEAEIDSLVDDIFISEVIGCQKPSIDFFNFVKKHIDGFSEEKALVIGDSPSSDILGGINAGIDTCFFDREGSGCPEAITPTYKISRLDELLTIV